MGKQSLRQWSCVSNCLKNKRKEERNGKREQFLQSHIWLRLYDPHLTGEGTEAQKDEAFLSQVTGGSSHFPAWTVSMTLLGRQMVPIIKRSPLDALGKPPS